jgi:hypothetical protein
MIRRITTVLIFILIISQYVGEFINNDFRSAFPKNKLSKEEVVFKIDSIKKTNLNIVSFLSKSNLIYSKGINYAWDSKIISVPFHKNYLFFLIKLLNKRFSLDETTDYVYALERGFGICSQNAMAFSELLLDKYKIETYVLGLGGHVVCYYKSSLNSGFIFDPSLGIDFEININNPNLDKIKQEYQKTELPNLYEFYDRNNNVLPDKPGSEGHRPKLYILEKLKYFYKYIIPLMLLVVLNKNFIRKSFLNLLRS